MGQSVFILSDEHAELIIGLLNKHHEEIQEMKEELKKRAKLSEQPSEPPKQLKTISVPESGFMRLADVLKIIPVGKSCWWEGVKSGRFPKPIKLSPRCTAWKADDIRNLIERIGYV